MATLGQTGTGYTFTVNAGAGWGDFAGGSYTVPNPGIIVSSIYAYIGNGGTSQSCRMYVWGNSSGKPAGWLIRGTSTQSLGGLGWNSQSSLELNGGGDLFLPGGYVIWIGAYLSAGSGQFEAASGSGGGSELGNTSDGNWSDHGPASVGQMAAYINYTLAGGAWINTGSQASPVWSVATEVAANTGSQASPVWTSATQVAVNTGTSASPIWTPGA